MHCNMNVKFYDILSSLRVIKATKVRKPGENRQLRLRRTWDDNIRMYHKETGCEGVD